MGIIDETFTKDELEFMTMCHIKKYYCHDYDYGDDNQLCKNSNHFCDPICVLKTK